MLKTKRVYFLVYGLVGFSVRPVFKLQDPEWEDSKGSYSYILDIPFHPNITFEELEKNILEDRLGLSFLEKSFGKFSTYKTLLYLFQWLKDHKIIDSINKEFEHPSYKYALSHRPKRKFNCTLNIFIKHYT